MHSPIRRFRLPRLNSAMCQGLRLTAVSEARANACVSIYSRIFVTLPFRTVMSKTQSSLNGLFVALIFPVANADDQNPVSLRYELGGLWVRSFHRLVSLLK